MGRIGANKYTAYTYVTDTEKQCSSCKEIKDHSAFHKDPSNKRGRGVSFYCKECANRKAREHHARRHATVPEYRRAKRSAHVKTTYGITLEEYELKKASQDFRCSICGEDLRKHKHFAHLDHDHSTDVLRDFLCSNCNRGLGCFMDNPELLKTAAKYVVAHKEGKGPFKEGTCP